MHPAGECMDGDCVLFSPPPGTAEVAAASLAEPAYPYPPFVDLDDPKFGATDDDDIVRFG